LLNKNRNGIAATDMPRAATFNPRQLYVIICYFTGGTLFTSLSATVGRMRNKKSDAADNH